MTQERRMTAYPLPHRDGRKPGRARLLGGSAICGAAALLAHSANAAPPMLSPGALPDHTKVTTAVDAGGTAPGFTPGAAGSNLLTVDVNASRTIIDWQDGFNVGKDATVAFSGMNTGDIAVNRATQQMVIEGAVTGGGALWFLSPGGVLMNGGTVTAGGGVLMSNGTLDDSAFFGSTNAAGALAAIQVGAALINIDGVTPAVSAEVTASGDILLSSTSDLSVKEASGGAVTLTADGAVAADALTATGDLGVIGDTIDLATAEGASVSLTATGAITADALTATAGDLTVDGGSIAVDAATGEGVTVTATGAASGDAFTATTGDLNVTAAAIDVRNASAAGKATLDGPVKTTAATQVTAGAAGAAFTSTIDGAGGLTISTPGQVYIAGDVGATTPLASLTLDGASGLAFGGATLKTGGDLTLGPVTFGKAGAVSVSVGGDLSVGDLDAKDADVTSLTLTAGGALELSDVGQAVRLKSASFTGADGIALRGDVAVQQVATFASDVGTFGVRKVAGGAASFQNVAAGASGAELSLDVSGAAAFAGSAGAADAPLAGLAIKAGSASFAATNHVSTLAADVAAGGFDFSNGRALTVGTVDGLAGVTVGAGNVALSAGSGALTLSKDVATATGGQVSLSAATGVGQSGGLVKTEVLTVAVTAAGDIALTGANQFDKLAGASASGSIDIVDSRAMEVTGAVSGSSVRLVGAGLSFDDLSAAQDLTLDATTGALSGASATATSGDLTLSGASIALTGAATATGGSLSATAASGGLDLGSASAKNDVELAAAGALQVSGAALATDGDLTLSGASIALAGAATAGLDLGVTATGGDLALGGVSAGRNADLSAAGALDVSGSVSATGDYAVEAQDFAGSALAPTTLGGDFTIVDTAGGFIAGALAAPQHLSITSLGGDLVLTGNLTTGAGHTTSLHASGAVKQTGGTVTTGTITGSSHGGFTLDQANAFETLGAVTNTGSGGVTLVNTLALHIDATLDAGVNGAHVTAASIAFDDLVLDGAISLISSSGGVSGSSLTASGDVTLDSRESVSVTGAVNANGGSVSASAARGDLTLGAVTATKDVLLRNTDAGDGAAGDGGAIRVGAIRAGADVGVVSADGDVTASSIAAGDDVAMRALYGKVEVAGAVNSGRDMAGVTRTDDAAGAADGVVAGAKFPDFDPASTTDFALKGHDVDIQAQAIKVGGPIVAGVQQPGGDDPDLASTLDATPSDVRLRSQRAATPQADLAASILVGDVTATRDIQIDSERGVDTGALKAGQDVAVLARGADTTPESDLLASGIGATIGSAAAGRHVVVHSVYGRNRVVGPIEAGHAYPQLQPDSTGDTIDGAAERLAAYIRYLDLDDASGPHLSGPGDVVLKAAGIDVDGAISARGAVRMQADGTIRLDGAVDAGGDLRLDSADAAATAITSQGLAAGGDVAIRARHGGVSLGSLAAGDDVAVRAAGAVSVDGSVQAGAGADTGATGGADRLLGGGTGLAALGGVDLSGAAIDISGATSAAAGARLAATGAILAGDVTAAGGDVLLDSGAGVTAGRLSAGRDVAVRAQADLILGGATAGDDVALRTPGALTVSGGASAGGGPDAAGAADALVAQSGQAMTVEGQAFDLAGGGSLDLRAAGVTVTGAAQAAGAQADIRIQSTGGVALGALTAGRDVLVDAGGPLAAGGVSAGRDVGVRSQTAGVTLGAVAAGDDVVLRAAGDLAAGALTAGTVADSAAAGQAGELLGGADRLTLGARSYDYAGGDVDAKGAAVTVSGAIAAGSDVRLQARGALTSGAVAAAEGDVLADAGAGLSMGVLNAGADVAVRTTAGGATLGGAAAKDDVVIRAPGAVQVAGAITSGGGSDSAGAADHLIALAGAAMTVEGRTFGLQGNAVDIRGGGLTVGGPIRAASGTSDVRVQGGAVSLGAVEAGGDVLVDGSGAVRTGALTAGGDVGVRAAAALEIGDANAGDDVVLRTPGAVTAGALTTGGGADRAGAADLFAGVDKISLGGGFDLTGANVDVKAAAVRTDGGSAADDYRVQAAGAATVGDTRAGRDVLLDGASLTAGALTGGGDVAVYVRNGDLTLGALEAGDDVVLRARGSIATGALTTGRGADRAGAGDLLAGFDKIEFDGPLDLIGANVDVKAGGAARTGGGDAAGDYRVQASGVVSVDATRAGRDVLLDGAAVTAGAVTAARDMAVYARRGDLKLGAAEAGDDLVLRARGSIITGALTTGGGADRAGAGDLLAGLDKLEFGGAFDMTGANVDVKAGGDARTGGGDAAGDYRVQATGAVMLGATAAGGDLLLDGASVTAGDLTGGGDVAVYARSGDVVLGATEAGDDIVVRTTGALTADALLTRGDGDGAAGDRLAAVAGRLAVSGQDFALDGADIDLRAARVALGGDASAARDLRIQTETGAQLAGLKAQRDVLVDAGGAVAAGAVQAGRDVGLRSKDGGVTLAAVRAGDDVVLRAAGDVTVSGEVAAEGGGDAEGAADLLFAADRSALAGDFDLAGATLDIGSRDGSIALGGAARAAGDLRLQTAGAAGQVRVASASAGRDVLLDGAGALAVWAGELTAGGDIAVRGRDGGEVALASATAGDDLVVRTRGAVTASGALTASGAGDRTGAADRLAEAGSGLAGGALALEAGDLAVADLRATGDLRLQTAGGVRTGNLGAGGDVLVDAGRLVEVGAVAAGRDVALRSGQGLSLASATAGDDIVLRAAQGVSVAGGLSAGGGPDQVGAADHLAATGGAIRWAGDAAAPGTISDFDLAGANVDVRAGSRVTVGGAIQAGTDARFEAPEELSLAGITAGRLAFARSASLGMTGDWKAPTVRIEAARPEGLVVGDGVAGAPGAMVLTAAQLNRIDADTVQIFAGDTSNGVRGAGLTIGALAVDVGRIRSSLELYAGPEADVIIARALAPSSSGTNATRLRIGAADALVGAWTPRSIRIVADDGGAIGYATTPDGRTFANVRAFGSVELNARDSILAGYQIFLDRIATAQPSEVVALLKTLTAPQGPNGPAMLLTAGALTMRAGRIAQQDTSSPVSLTRTGLYVNGLLTLGGTGATGPDMIELYGAISNGSTVLTNENAPLSRNIVLEDGVRPSQSYRLNTCTILSQAACTAQGGAPSITGPHRINRLQLFDSRDAGVTEDPTAASATNEEIWRDPE